MRRYRSALISALFIALSLPATLSRLQAEMTNLLPAADTRLSMLTPAANEGSAATFVAGTQGTLASSAKNRALLRFDLAGRIPAGAVVTSVRLSISVAKSPNTSLYNFDLRRVLKGWAENEATWMIRLSPNVAWDEPGGVIGADFSETISASQRIGGTNTYVFGSTSNLVADVQDWLANPATNFGWVLMTSDEEISFSARRFASRENTVLPPPLLEVQYTPSAPPPRIDLIAHVDGAVQLHFTVPATFCYDVQFRESLPGTSWSTLTNICASVTAQNVIVSDSLSHPQRFYRLAVTGQVR